MNSSSPSNRFVHRIRAFSASASLNRLRQFSPRWLIGLGLVGLSLIAVPIIQTRSTGTANTEAVRSEGILPVKTVTAQSVDAYEVSRAYTGEVASLQASELGFERSGQLTQLLAPEGRQVQAGEPLARLDVRNLQTQRLQIEAEKARANAQLLELEVGARTEDIAAARFAVKDLEQQTSLQETQLARRQILYDRGAISREELDEYKFGEGSLQARLDQARSNLQELQNGTRPEQISAQEALVQQLDARLADLDVTIAKSTLKGAFSGTVCVLGHSQTKAKQLEQVDKTTPTVAIQRFLLRPGAWWTEGLSTPRLARPYQWSLRRTTACPLLEIALSFTIPLIGFISASTLSQQFFPAVSRDQLQIEVEFAPQSAIARTRQQIDRARDLILSHPNVEEIHWFIGESAPKFYYNFTDNRRNQAQYAQAIRLFRSSS